MEEVPRRTSLVPLGPLPLFVLCLIGVETEGILDYQGWAGTISIVRWNLCPVIFGVEVVILRGAWGMTSSDFCCVAIPLEYQRMLSNGDVDVVWNPSEAIVVTCESS